MLRTQGISPKLIAAVTAVGGPGLFLLIFGIVFDIPELRAAGAALLGGGALAGGAGYQAPAAENNYVPVDEPLEEHDSALDPHPDETVPLLDHEDHAAIGSGAGTPPLTR